MISSLGLMWDFMSRFSSAMNADIEMLRNETNGGGTDGGGSGDGSAAWTRRTAGVVLFVANAFLFSIL